MFKTVCALIVGVLVFVGCREAKRSPEEQAKIDEYIAELYAKVEAEKKEEAQTKQIGSILANTAAATNPRAKAVAYWPMALIDVFCSFRSSARNRVLKFSGSVGRNRNDETKVFNA